MAVTVVERVQEVKIHFCPGVFVRHIKDESVIWCPCSGGCTMLRDSRPFLEEIAGEWRGVDEIVRAVAAKFDCKEDAVRGDFAQILDELRSQNFVECEIGDNAFGKAEVEEGRGEENAHPLKEESEVGFPLDDFCEQHGIAADLHIDLTDACTERCVHCYVPRGQRDFLPVELVEKVLAEFRAMNGLTVHLTGGEAMMHPDFERICRKCVELNLNFISFSNMTLCDEKRIAFLKEVQPQFINVSLYSMDPVVHDAITQLPGSWQKTHDAVVKCCEAGVACRIATPLLKENQDALPALRMFADEHRMHLVPAADIIAQADHGCGNLAHACSTEELRRVLTRDHDLFHKVYNTKMPACDAKVCDIGSARLYLNAKGNYYPCDSMHEYVLGNVRENTVEEIWKGEKLNYLRGLKNRDFGACAACENRPWCKVCPAANFNATGDLFKHHPSTCALAGVIKEVYGKRLKHGSMSSSM